MIKINKLLKILVSIVIVFCTTCNIFAADNTASLSFSDISYDATTSKYSALLSITNAVPNQQATIIVYAKDADYNKTENILYLDQQSITPDEHNQFYLTFALNDDITGILTARAGGTGVLEPVTFDFSAKTSPQENISGHVALSNGDKSLITINLYENTSIATDKLVNPLYTAKANSEGNWTFPVYVPPGTYTLVIIKPGASYYRKNNFIVDTSENIVVETKTLLPGDINSNGNIDADDLQILIDSSNFNRAVNDAIDTLCDLNNSRRVDADDLQILIDSSNFNKQSITEN